MNGFAGKLIFSNKFRADESPGEDDLTGEFYNHFKDVIKKTLTEVKTTFGYKGNNRHHTEML